MKRVYICSPLSGDIEGNVKRALEYCRVAVRAGCVPYAPHVYFTRFLDDEMPAERKIGIDEGLSWLRLCDEIWVFGGTVSSGMKSEIELAEVLGLPVLYLNPDGSRRPVRP